MNKWQTFEKKFNTNGIVDALEWWKKTMEEEQKIPVLGNEADQGEAMESDQEALMEKAEFAIDSAREEGIVL